MFFLIPVDQCRPMEMAQKVPRHLEASALQPLSMPERLSPCTDPDFVSVTQGEALRGNSDCCNLLLAQSILCLRRLKKDLMGRAEEPVSKLRITHH